MDIPFSDPVDIWLVISCLIIFGEDAQTEGNLGIDGVPAKPDHRGNIPDYRTDISGNGREGYGESTTERRNQQRHYRRRTVNYSGWRPLLDVEEAGRV